MKIRFSRHTRHTIATGKKTYMVGFYQQPLRDHLIAKAYNFYSWRVFRVPGYQLIDRWQTRRHERGCSGDCATGTDMRTGKRTPMCVHMPLSAAQDVRSFELGRKNRVDLGDIEVPEELYRKLNGHDE